MLTGKDVTDLVFGDTSKAVVQEKCGNGIMRAIGLGLPVEKVPNPQVDRIELRMRRRFLAHDSW